MSKLPHNNIDSDVPDTIFYATKQDINRAIPT